MAKKPVVLCVDLLPPAVRALMTAEKPDCLELVFAESAAEEERETLTDRASAVAPLSQLSTEGIHA